MSIGPGATPVRSRSMRPPLPNAASRRPAAVSRTRRMAFMPSARPANIRPSSGNVVTLTQAGTLSGSPPASPNPGSSDPSALRARIVFCVSAMTIPPSARAASNFRPQIAATSATSAQPSAPKLLSTPPSGSNRRRRVEPPQVSLSPSVPAFGPARRIRPSRCTVITSTPAVSCGSGPITAIPSRLPPNAVSG